MESLSNVLTTFQMSASRVYLVLAIFPLQGYRREYVMDMFRVQLFKQVVAMNCWFCCWKIAHIERVEFQYVVS